MGRWDAEEKVGAQSPARRKQFQRALELLPDPETTRQEGHFHARVVPSRFELLFFTAHDDVQGLAIRQHAVFQSVQFGRS